jgi:hypothetical protein
MAKDLFERPGYWTGRRVHIGFVLPNVGPEVAAWRKAVEAVGAAIMSALPARVFLYNSDAPADAADLDVVVVTDPEFDVRRLARLSTIGWLAAWAHGDAAAWGAPPSAEAFDLWFAGREDAEGLRRRLGKTVTQLPHGPEAAGSVAAEVLAALRQRAAEGPPQAALRSSFRRRS